MFLLPEFYYAGTGSGYQACGDLNLQCAAEHFVAVHAVRPGICGSFAGPADEEPDHVAGGFHDLLHHCKNLRDGRHFPDDPGPGGRLGSRRDSGHFFGSDV